MSNIGFVHLHNHTTGSLLDGFSAPSQYVKRLQEVGQSSMAITDHGNMFMALDFYRSMKKASLHPVIGMEAYIVQWGNTIAERGNANREANHMLLLAQNQKGYENLVKLSSIGFLEGFYYKPKIDWEVLDMYSEGIICTSGCMAAPINQAVQEGNIELAETMIKWHKDIFEERFYIELQVHPGIPELNPVNKTLIELGKKYNIKCILTNDSHYATVNDADPHGIMLCVQVKKSINDPKRFKFTDNDYYLKSAQEMRNMMYEFMDDESIDDMFRRTIEIAESCEVNPEGDMKPKIPHIDVPSPFVDTDSFLATQATQGLYKLLNGNVPDEYTQRLYDELDVIKTTGFAAYYLIIKDICEYAERNKISWNTRGSAAGSLVFWAIGVSFVDPIENKLLFSRFLNTFRVSIPDCDLDFPDSQRHEIVKYIIEKYGEDRVAQVITFGKMKARMSIRDVGRALGYSQDYVDGIAKSIKNTPGKPINISNSLDPDSEYYSEDFANYYSKDKNAKIIIDYAKSLEDKARHTGVHAAAVLITPTKLTDYIPLTRGGKTAFTSHIAQWEYVNCESIGLLKVDCLGLSTQTIIDRVCALINERHGTNYNYHNIPYNDESSYQLLCDTNLIGVFQVENQGLRKAIGLLQPRKFSQVADIISLYRPGPIQYIPEYIEQTHNPVDIKYKHKLLEPILKDTAGICIFQEQVIQILVQLAGYTEVEADGIRKAISKKDVDKIAKGREHFVTGCKQKAISEKIATAIYNDIEKFALYSFNRAHAASYARITLITAWLKANYCLEYLTGCLMVEGSDEAKRVKYINDAKRNGIDILPPKIGLSGVEFHIDGNAIRFGWENVKEVGAKASKSLGKIKSLNELVKLKLDKGVIEAITSAGVFDEFGIAPKGLLLSNLDEFMVYIKTLNKINNMGQYALTYPDIEIKNTKPQKLSVYERKYLGVWLQHHPLKSNAKYDKIMKQYSTTLVTSLDIQELEDGTDISFVGVLQEIREVVTKNGKKMGFVTLSDDDGLFQVVLFPKMYEGLNPEENQIFNVQGKIQYSNDEISILANRIQRLKSWE